MKIKEILNESSSNKYYSDEERPVHDTSRDATSKKIDLSKFNKYAKDGRIYIYPKHDYPEGRQHVVMYNAGDNAFGEFKQEKNETKEDFKKRLVIGLRKDEQLYDKYRKSPNNFNERVNLRVSYRDKDIAKKYGASWDRNSKQWYFSNPSPRVLKFAEERGWIG